MVVMSLVFSYTMWKFFIIFQAYFKTECIFQMFAILCDVHMKFIPHCASIRKHFQIILQYHLTAFC